MKRSRTNSHIYWRSIFCILILLLGADTRAQTSWHLGQRLESNYSGFNTITSVGVGMRGISLELGLLQNWSQNYLDHMQLGMAIDLMFDLGAPTGTVHRLGLSERSEWPLKELSVHQILLSSSHHWSVGDSWALGLQMGYGLVWERTAPYLSNRHKRAGMVNVGCAYTLHI